MSEQSTTLPDWLTELTPGDGRFILCRLCKAAITDSSQELVMGNRSSFRFTNPAGIRFFISCYQQAPGCSLVGRPTQDNSWFGGYYWQLALCTDCNEHLGWYYENRQRGFFGLIRDRLFEQAGDSR